jgi:hypothetical protein
MTMWVMSDRAIPRSFRMGGEAGVQRPVIISRNLMERWRSGMVGA